MTQKIHEKAGRPKGAPAFSISLVLIAFALGGCSTIRLMDSANPQPQEPPSYREVKDFYFWGLKGEHHVYIADVCGTRPATQIVRQQTFFNGVMAALTLGIYVPQTLTIWCERSKTQ